LANRTLAASYLKKVSARMLALDTLYRAKAYSDVIRECQESFELLTKALLRLVAIDPPKWHDVGPIIEENSTRFPDAVASQVGRIASSSKALRKERELSFYGEDDFLPDESYTEEQAQHWIAEVQWLCDILMNEFKNELE
jgi:HEPN domain-containing protein